MTHELVNLAQAVATKNGLAPALTWAAILLVIVIAAGAGILIYRARIFGDESSMDAQSGVLDQLRAMRNRGDLTPEEFDDMKSRMVARLTGTAASRPARRAAAQPNQTRVTSARENDVLRAKPGYDLTGAPLPRPSERPGDSSTPPPASEEH